MAPGTRQDKEITKYNEGLDPVITSPLGNLPFKDGVKVRELLHNDADRALITCGQLQRPHL
jgi:hypothetical protein